MKKNIHPQWHHDAVVTCSCGHTFTTGSTQKTLNVDICSQCHPFFTGEMKFVDRQGRVDRFLQKMKAAQAKQKARQQKQKKKPQEQKQEPLTYKQLLQQKKRALQQVKKSAAKAE